jgi:hypothetical protein
MQAYEGFLEAEPGKHPIVIVNSWLVISGHSEIISAFSGARRSRPYGRSDLCQIALHLFRASCDVFIYSTAFASCHGCVLSMSQCFFSLESTVVTSPATLARIHLARLVKTTSAALALPHAVRMGRSTQVANPVTELEKRVGTGIYTVGHSNQTLDSFLSVLVDYKTTAAAAVGSYPYSKANRQFNRQTLTSALESQKIAYVLLGTE